MMQGQHVLGKDAPSADVAFPATLASILLTHLLHLLPESPMFIVILHKSIWQQQLFLDCICLGVMCMQEQAQSMYDALNTFRV